MQACGSTAKFLIDTGSESVITVAVVEDDDKEAERIKSYLVSYGKENDENFNVLHFSDRLEFLEKIRPEIDVVFMDIEMPFLNGMDAAKKLRQSDLSVPLVFITNLKQYALNGYEVEAMDFLVKPVAYAAFSTMMGRVCARLALCTDKEIFIQNAQGGVKIKISDIFYVEVIKHYVIFHTPRGEVKMWGSLSDIEKRLPADRFARCNNCYLVHLAYATRLEGNDLYVGGDVLAVSRGKKQEFMQRLLDYMER